MTYYKASGVSDGFRKRSQSGFGGYDHRLGAADGTVYDMKNMSGDYYPLASPRAPRTVFKGGEDKLSDPRGIAASDQLYWWDDTYIYGTDGRKWYQKLNIKSPDMTFMGKGLIIAGSPGKILINTGKDGEVFDLQLHWSDVADFADGTYAGEEAEGCCIVTTGMTFPFKVGDAVTITGAENEKNNTTLIIREISEDKKTLGFYEHSFINAKNQMLTISRKVPDMDYICEHENRLFGCKGDTIYASKLGDPYNFNVFDGLASDSFSVTTGSAGDFTGCVSYGGFVIFFKEDKIFKLYGDKPSNYKLMSSATLGVKSGCHASLAIAGETLYYLSRIGVMAYTGGIPTCISDVFGGVRYESAVGGSDGVKYYISAHDVSCNEDEGWSLFCYDTRYREWWREDDTHAISFAYCIGKGLYMLTAGGEIYVIGATPEAETGCKPEEKVESMMEFFDITESSTDKKHVNSIQLRLMLSEGAFVTVYMSFDGEPYSEVDTITDTGKASYYIPCRLHRCDYYRIRIVGTGDWKLCSMTREYSSGSEM